MLDSCLERLRSPVRLTRKSARPLRYTIAIVLAGLALIAYASLTVVPSAAATSGPGQDIRLDKALAPSEQTGQSGIASPATGSRVSGSVPVLGTASGSPFARFELYFKPEPSGDEAYVWFAGETFEVRNGQLGVWRTADLAPGIYTLRLRVVRPDGNYGEFFARNISVNQEVETPTPEGPTPTPIPIDTPTPFPQPTVAPVRVEQPDIEEPTPAASPSPEPAAQGNGGGDDDAQRSSGGQSVIQNPPTALDNITEALSLNRLRARFFMGVRWSAGLFLLLGAVFAAKRLLEWVASKAD